MISRLFRIVFTFGNVSSGRALVFWLGLCATAPGVLAPRAAQAQGTGVPGRPRVGRATAHGVHPPRATPALTQSGTLTTLYTFSGPDGMVGDGSDDGGYGAHLIQASDGNFYGTTIDGGANGFGTVFRLTPDGVLTTLHSFADDPDGSEPDGAIIQASDGNFYGTTFGGGSNDSGTVFSMTPAGAVTILYSFTGDADGSHPQSALLETAAGFYGTTTQGGANGNGVIYTITTAGVQTVIHSFDDTDGDRPDGPLVQTSDGNFYGTTFYGGTAGDGTIFQLSPAGTLTTFHSFNDTDGNGPAEGLLVGHDGNIYGTTAFGGTNEDGTIFRLDPGTGLLTTLYNFNGDDGTHITTGLIQVANGDLFGTAGEGGGDGEGTVFSLTLDGTLTTIYTFTGASDGANPYSGVIQGTDGNFYGVTEEGGSNSDGTAFKLSVVPPPGMVQFASASSNTTESAGSVTLTVSRVGGSAGAVSVDYSETDGTALVGLDYQVTSGTLTWADGDATDKTITIPISDRQIYNDNTVFFSVGLTNPTGGATLGTIPTATVNILDNDVAPQPTVVIVSPPNNITVISGSALPLAASVVDPAGVLASVQFLLNGTPVDTTSATAPYVFATMAPATPGTYSIAAVANDSLGRANTSTITLNVIAPVTGSTLPAATLLTPVANRNLAAGATVTLDFTGSADPGTALARLTLYADGLPIATFDGNGNPLTSAASTRPTRTGAPTALTGTLFQANYTLPATDKFVNLIAVALDKLGQSTVSAATSIHATMSSHAAPLVALGGISSGMHFKIGSNTAVSVNASGGTSAAVRPAGPTRADATSDSQLALLEYYLNGIKLAQALQPPFSFTFTPPAAGTYVLHAVATDASGLATVSAPVVVQADAPPAVSVTAASGVVMEGGAKGVVVFTRTGDTGAPLTVRYKATGSAQAGVDYKPLSGTVTIPAGAAKAKLKLKPLDDEAFDGTRVAKLKLLPATDDSYTLDTAAVAKIKFVNDH